MITDYSEGWNKRNVRYEEIHNVPLEDLALMVQSLDFQDGDIFADLMCGYGAVTKAALDYCALEGIKIKPILVDMYKEQIQRSCAELPDTQIIRLCEDSRSLSLPDNSADRIAIKMGLHEVPRKDQYRVIAQVYRALKPGGKFVIWEIMPKTHIEQLLFQTIVREKDRLSGFPGLAVNRYLPREEELRVCLQNAGFSDIELIKEMRYTLSSEKRLYAELGGDEGKLEEWNEFIRAIVPDNVKDEINFSDKGYTIEATFRKGILKAVKPYSSSKDERGNM